jgi:molecular chaperone GrpE
MTSRALLARRTIHVLQNVTILRGKKQSMALLPQFAPTTVAGSVRGCGADLLAMPTTRWFASDNSSSSSNNNNNNKPASSDETESEVVTEHYEKSDLKDQAEAEEEDVAKNHVLTREEQLELQVKELEIQLKDLKNQLLRSLAEQENTRRIAQRDVDASKQYAIRSFAKGLLDVADNLERALSAVPPESRADAESNHVLATLYEGIALTEKGLTKTFESNGLLKFGKVGELFDPNRHEALFEYVDPSKTPGTVGQVTKPGYMLNKRVIRPADVGVVKKE